jgi:hypothetical protein
MLANCIMVEDAYLHLTFNTTTCTLRNYLTKRIMETTVLDYPPRKKIMGSIHVITPNEWVYLYTTCINKTINTNKHTPTPRSPIS